MGLRVAVVAEVACDVIEDGTLHAESSATSFLLDLPMLTACIYYIAWN